jgi:hypothetical protein
MSVKPGYKTTELLVSALAGAGAWLAAWDGTLPAKYAALASAVSAAAYALSRAITKHGVATSGQPVVTVPAAPVPAPTPPPPGQAI